MFVLELLSFRSQGLNICLMPTTKVGLLLYSSIWHPFSWKLWFTFANLFSVLISHDFLSVAFDTVTPVSQLKNSLLLISMTPHSAVHFLFLCPSIFHTITSFPSSIQPWMLKLLKAQSQYLPPVTLYITIHTQSFHFCPPTWDNQGALIGPTNTYTQRHL